MLRFTPAVKRSLLAAAIILTACIFFFKESLHDVGKASLAKLSSSTPKPGLDSHDHPPNREEMIKEIRSWQQQSDVKKIVGLVFYGRRAQASILDCYLKRNLLKNGGILDEVIWLQRTRDELDLAFLDEIVASDADYKRVDVEGAEGGYASAYDTIEDDVFYVKVDTDIVYIEDTTILGMVHTRATRPDYFVIGANVINQPLSSWVHWNLGALRPYLPETETTPEEEMGIQNDKPVDWRASLLPAWKGSPEFTMEGWNPPENRKHRWLPVTNRLDHVLDKTPIVEALYDAYSGPGWWKWTLGAQAHYSLFENLERKEMWRYRFHTWDYRDLRMGLQFIAMTGRDLNLAKPIAQDDEGHLTVTMPKKLGRNAVADGRGVAVHYSFNAQIGGMSKTDILDRYRAYAQENICKGKMLWTSDADDERLKKKPTEV